MQRLAVTIALVTLSCSAGRAQVSWQTDWKEFVLDLNQCLKTAGCTVSKYEGQQVTWQEPRRHYRPVLHR